MVSNIVTRHSASTILFNFFHSYKQWISTTLFNPVELQAHDLLPRPCANRDLKSTTRPVRQRVSNFSSKMNPKLFNAVKV